MKDFADLEEMRRAEKVSAERYGGLLEQIGGDPDKIEFQRLLFQDLKAELIYVSRREDHRYAGTMNELGAVSKSIEELKQMSSPLYVQLVQLLKEHKVVASTIALGSSSFGAIISKVTGLW